MERSSIKRRGQPKRKLSPLQRVRLFRLCAVLFLLFFAWVLFSPGSGLLAIWRKRQELHDLNQQNQQLEASNAQLQQEIDKLQNDPAYLEEIARREHNLLKKNERVFEFAPKKSAKEE